MEIFTNSIKTKLFLDIDESGEILVNIYERIQEKSRNTFKIADFIKRTLNIPFKVKKGSEIKEDELLKVSERIHQKITFF